MKNKALFFVIIAVLFCGYGFAEAADIPQEFYISPKGEIHLRGGEVKIKNALNILTIEIWGQRWVVVADYATKFESRYGETMKPEEISVGDKLEVRGKPMPEQIGQIDTLYIRDLSIETGSPKEEPSLQALFCPAPQTINPPSPPTPTLPMSLSTPSLSSPETAAIASAPGAASFGGFARDIFWGMKGDAVKLVQLFLIKNGYDIGTPDATGFFGAGTYAAVRKFQKAHGLKPLGKVGPATRALIQKELAK